MKKLNLRKIGMIGALMVSIFNYNCSSPISTLKSPENSFGTEKVSKQTISNVSIEVEPLSPTTSLYEHPELFEFNKDDIDSKLSNGPALYYRKDAKGKYFCYTLGMEGRILNAFKVKITNNTPHILRMKDARIYLVAGDDEPVKATSELGNSRLNPNGMPHSAVVGDESVIHWVTYFESLSKDATGGIMGYPVGFSSQVISQNKSKYKLINDVSKEILPDFSYSGLLIFPSLINPSAQDVKLMFYDITTKTDAAGNAIEKTKFEFSLSINEIDMFQDDYNKWQIGIPPSATTK